MSQKSNYQLLIQPDWSHDRLLKVLKATAADGYYDITLVAPGSVRSLERVNDYFELKKLSNELSLNLSFSGGNETMRETARAVGFRIIGLYTENAKAGNAGTTTVGNQTNQALNYDQSIMMALATIKALLISKGIFDEDEYQEMLQFVEQQWKGK